MMRRWLPMDCVKKMNESELFIEFNNGSILSLHGSDKPDSIRGVDFRGVVIDEAAICKRSLYEEILRPIIAQSKDRWMMAITTPKGKANWFYDYWVRCRDNPEWGRYQLSAEDSGLFAPEELEKAKKEMPARVYAQEMCCSFEDSSRGVFKNIESCIAGNLEQPKQGFSYCVGVDLAKVDDFSILTVICRETKHVVAFERFNQIDWAVQKERILQICNKYNAPAIIDATGLGSPIVEDLIRQGLSVVPFQITAQSKKQLIEKLMVAIEQRHITFPNIPVLVEELGLFQYDVTDFGNVRYAAPEGNHDDAVISLALAVMGMGSYMYGKKERPRILKTDTAQANCGFGF